MVLMIKQMRSNVINSVKSLAFCSCFLAAGITSTIVGTTMLDLQEQTRSSLDQITFVLTARSIGLGAGALICKSSCLVII